MRYINKAKDKVIRVAPRRVILGVRVERRRCSTRLKKELLRCPLKRHAPFSNTKIGPLRRCAHSVIDEQGRAVDSDGFHRTSRKQGAPGHQSDKRLGEHCKEWICGGRETVEGEGEREV